MAYSRSETIRIAKEVKASAESFLSSVCNLPNNVNTFIDNVNSVMSDIKKDISDLYDFSIIENNFDCEIYEKLLINYINNLKFDINLTKRCLS